MSLIGCNASNYRKPEAGYIYLYSALPGRSRRGGKLTDKNSLFAYVWGEGPNQHCGLFSSFDRNIEVFQRNQ
jgi:hypothetical protein